MKPFDNFHISPSILSLAVIYLNLCQRLNCDVDLVTRELKMDKLYHDKLYVSRITASIMHSFKQRCFSECVQRSDCHSLSYDKYQQECVLYDTFITSSDVYVEKVGLLYYRMVMGEYVFLAVEQCKHIN